MTSPTSQPPSEPGSPLSRASDAHQEWNRALIWGLGVSVGVHFLLLLVYPALVDRMEAHLPEIHRPDPELVDPGVELVLLDELTDLPEEPEEDELPQEVPVDSPPPDPDLPPAEPAEEVGVEPGEEEVDEPGPMDEDEVRRHVAELLRPQTPDPRLWRPDGQAYLELSDEERARLMIYGMMQDWNDSVAVAAALSEGARDWTYTDEEGRRWGLSPGRIHLGDFSVPLPFSFETPPGLRDRANRQQWINEDIARGAAAAAIRETWAERAQEIRRRMDEERERERSGGGG